MESLTTLKPDFYKEIAVPSIGLRGFVVIDKQMNGCATGGIRIAEDVSLEEVANLAHAMTFKYAFLNIKKDGAKAGIVIPLDTSIEKKRELCFAFGKAIAELIKTQKYSPGEDLGTNSIDLSHVLKGAGTQYLINKDGLKSEYFTALTVYLVTHALLRTQEKELRDISVIIEGIGKVGTCLLELFAKSGARIVGVSTLSGAIYDQSGLNPEKIVKLKNEYGNTFVNHYSKEVLIDKKSLFEKQADILVPGARPDSINYSNIEKIKSKMIVPIANIAAVERVEELLFEKGIVYVPGFVSNCGGILAYFLYEQGFSVEEVESLIRDGFPQRIINLISEAKKNNKSISCLAREQALSNIGKLQKESQEPVFKKLHVGKILWLAYKTFSRIGIGSFLKPYARRYIHNLIFNPLRKIRGLCPQGQPFRSVKGKGLDRR